MRAISRFGGRAVAVAFVSAAVAFAQEVSDNVTCRSKEDTGFCHATNDDASLVQFHRRAHADMRGNAHVESTSRTEAAARALGSIDGNLSTITSVPANGSKDEGCTSAEQDPYWTGHYLACCAGLEKTLEDWNGDGHYSYRCVKRRPCQRVVDDYCRRKGTSDIKCAENQKLYARFSGSPNLAAGDRWRCYAEDALYPDLTKWKGGEHCFCSRQEEIWDVWWDCSPAPAYIRVFYPSFLGVECYRIPAVAQTARGVLIAFAEARHGGCADQGVWEIAARRSFDGGKTWEAKGTFAVGSESFRVGNPAVVSTRYGRTLVMYATHSKACAGNCATGNGLVWSDDDGETWSNPYDISGQMGDAVKSLPGPGNMVELTSGRIVAAVHKGYYEAVYILYSDDHGMTWTLSSARHKNMDEVTIAQYPNGNVVVNMRHLTENLYGRGQAKSYDDGVTWTTVEDVQPLGGPVCEGSLASFEGVVYFSNPVSSTAREELAIHCSIDNGQTWSNLKPIQRPKSDGYSALVQSKLAHWDDQKLGILFEAQEKGYINFAAVSAWSSSTSCLLERDQV